MNFKRTLLHGTTFLFAPCASSDRRPFDHRGGMARHFAEKVQKDYIRYVKNFTAFLGRSPEPATSEDLRLFQLHMTRNHVSPASINCAIVAFRFFFEVTLERDDLVRRLTFVREPRKAPIVLSPEEVARLLEAAPGVKYALHASRRHLQQPA